MDKKLDAVFELGRAAMLALKDGKIIGANSRARELFGRELVGSSPVGVLPSHILSCQSESFVSSALIGGRAFSAQLLYTDGVRYIALEPERSRADSPELLSDNLMASMLSTLFNIGMTIDRLNALAGNGSSEKQDEYLTMLNHNYYSMRHSLSNLSTAIGLRKGSLPFFFRAVDLARLCSDLTSTVSHMCADMGVSIEFSTQHGEMFAYADEEKIERLLLNLLSNALAHTPSGGRISMGLERSGDTAYISVDDTGSGIPKAMMAELFTAWDREMDLAAMAESGGGLGLGIARGLAEAHDGALIIESREGKGCSVRVMLPLKSASLSVLESPLESYANSGMSLILTELAPILGRESYSKKYTD